MRIIAASLAATGVFACAVGGVPRFLGLHGCFRFVLLRGAWPMSALRCCLLRLLGRHGCFGTVSSLPFWLKDGLQRLGHVFCASAGQPRDR